MGGDEASPVHELFTRGTLILSEPKRSVLRRYRGPKMALAVEGGSVLAHLHERGTLAYVLRDLGNGPCWASTSSPEGPSPGRASS